jgi:hypothetical protein
MNINLGLFTLSINRNSKVVWIDHIDKFWKFWSVRISLVGIGLFTLLTASPDLLTNAWLQLPDEFKSLVPEQYITILGATIFVLNLVSRSIKQVKLNNELGTSDDNDVTTTSLVSQSPSSIRRVNGLTYEWSRSGQVFTTDDPSRLR